MLGRLATRIAIVLMGKHKPIYDPACVSPRLCLPRGCRAHLFFLPPPRPSIPPTADCGDYVVVTNCEKVRVTGKKAEQKVYRHHTMFPGGLKTITYKTMMEKNPENVRLRRRLACAP